MKLRDAKHIVDMFSKEWDLGKKSSGGKKNVCAWIYFCDIMAESEKIIIKRKDKQVIGVCGYAKWNSKKHLLRKKLYSVVKKILINSNLIENKKAMYEYLNDYNYTPKQLENYFDGEISIIIVDKKHRNTGIGKKLILEIFEIAKKDNMKNIQILTDESCNYKFYENVGCVKVYEKTIPNREPSKCGNSESEVGFIYEKKLI